METNTLLVDLRGKSIHCSILCSSPFIILASNICQPNLGEGFNDKNMRLHMTSESEVAHDVRDDCLHWEEQLLQDGAMGQNALGSCPE